MSGNSITDRLADIHRRLMSMEGIDCRQEVADLGLVVGEIASWMDFIEPSPKEPAPPRDLSVTLRIRVDEDGRDIDWCIGCTDQDTWRSLTDHLRKHVRYARLVSATIRGEAWRPTDLAHDSREVAELLAAAIAAGRMELEGEARAQGRAGVAAYDTTFADRQIKAERRLRALTCVFARAAAVRIQPEEDTP